MTFDPTSVEVTCVTVPKDHYVQVPWEYVNVCGYSYQFCKNYHIHTYTHILRTYYVHTTYYVQNQWSHSLSGETTTTTKKWYVQFVWNQYVSMATWRLHTLCRFTVPAYTQAIRFQEVQPWGGGGGGTLNLFSGRGVRPEFPKCGAFELIFASEMGLVKWKFPNLGDLWTENVQIWGFVCWNFPNLGACELNWGFRG